MWTGGCSISEFFMSPNVHGAMLVEMCLNSTKLWEMSGSGAMEVSQELGTLAFPTPLSLC